MLFHTIKNSTFLLFLLFLAMFAQTGGEFGFKTLAKGHQPGSETRDSSPNRIQQQRRNAGLFFDKLRAGKEVTVAYIGGSVAAGLGVNNPEKNSYRALVTEWLRKNFSK